MCIKKTIRILRRCTDGGFLKIYLQGQEERQALDEFDLNLCGMTLPNPVLSDGPRLSMVFSSGPTSATTGRDSKHDIFLKQFSKPSRDAYYPVADYKVPGTPAPTARATSPPQHRLEEGGLQQPPPPPPITLPTPPAHTTSRGRHPDQDSLQLLSHEDAARPRNHRIQQKCARRIGWKSTRSSRMDAKASWVGIVQSLLRSYCIGQGVHTMKVVLHTDAEGVASGFLASYLFIDPSRNSMNVALTSAVKRLGDNESRIPCQIQGQTTGDPLERGCPGAVVRVWKNLSQAPIELCGLEASNDTLEISSTNSVLKLTFATAEKAIGAEGFKAVWTEITETSDCQLFKCRESGFCIANELKCNKEPNCGWTDRSDEEDCEEIETVNVYLIVGLTMGIAFSIFLTICLVCHRKRKRRRHHHHHHHQHPPPPFEPRQKRSPPFDPPEFGPMNFMSIDSV
ncbi:cubilin [Caerostris extrusa]|uniref:Cubilin n=1 Tax=Caerostris extrusa TaxID=172846 RepID=A0AAV4UW61_CAEEX|nr:cubilin [Caerostris extrusa]